MNIVIIDDDEKFIDIIKNEFSAYFHSLLDSINYQCFSQNFNHLKINVPDIAFVDIDLDGSNGIHLAQKIKKAYPQVILIYISSREDLVFQTLSTGLFQFIRKAKYQEDIPSVFAQLSDYLDKNFKKKVLDIKGRKYMIELKTIVYILSIGHDITIHTLTRDYTFRSSIQEILDEFDYDDLVQIQRNMVIHFDFVEYVSKSKIKMSDGQIYSVGRKYQNDLLDRYERYLLK